MFRWLFRAIFGPNKTEQLQQQRRWAAEEVSARRPDYYREGLASIGPEQYAAASRETSDRRKAQDHPRDTTRTPSGQSRQFDEERFQKAAAVYDRFCELEKARAEAKHQARLDGFEIANDNDRFYELEKARAKAKHQPRLDVFEMANDNDRGRER
jgi:hypothetical protein